MSNKLRPEVKEEWVRRLRSGEYDQGTTYLKKTFKSTGVTKYCCLGVLCEMAVERGATTEFFDPTQSSATLFGGSEGGSRTWTPNHVVTWAFGAPQPTSNEAFQWKVEYTWSTVGEYPDETSLGALNDHNVPFDVIADLIEQQY